MPYKDPEKRRACGVRCYQKNRDRILSELKEKRKSPDYKKKAESYNYKWKYGISTEDFNMMVEHQGGGCYICGSRENKRRGANKLVVDHNHKTGQVRSLLCNRCNMVVGLVESNPEIIEKAITYVNTKW